MLNEIIYKSLLNIAKQNNKEDFEKVMEQNIKEFVLPLSIKDLAQFNYKNPSITEMVLYMIYKNEEMNQELKKI